MWEKEDKKRRALHSLGLTDAEIAGICGVVPQSIRNWRIKRGLKGVSNNRLAETEHMRRLEMYWQGHTDIEIGERLGYSWTTIFHWRERNRLAPSHKRDRGDSLCWECERATASRCPWIDEGKRIWKSAKYPKNQETGVIVVECRHLKLEGREAAEMREELEKARLDYKIAEIEFNYAEADFQRAAILKLEAARERLNAIILLAKMAEKAKRRAAL